MKQIISIYKSHKITVDNYIINLIKSLPKTYIESSDKILKQYKYIQLIYGVDSNFKLKTPIVCRKNKDSKNLGSDKSHYFAKMILNSENIYISNPYIHYRTGKASISVVYKIDDMYYIFDINMVVLLEDLKLVEYNHLHDRLNGLSIFWVRYF